MSIKNVMKEKYKKDNSTCKTNKGQNEIIDVASDLFSKKGYHGTSMRAISDISKINLAYIYKHVLSKNEILYLFYKNLYDNWSTVFNPIPLEKNESPAKKIHRLIRSILELNQSQKNKILTMYTESRHLGKEYLKEVLSLELKMVEKIQSVIDEGIKTKVFKVEDSYIAANLIQYLLVFDSLRGWTLKGHINKQTLADNLELYIFRILCFKGDVKKL